MTRVVDCAVSTKGELLPRPQPAAGPEHDCEDKRNCIMLQGLYECTAGLCTYLHWPYHCTRWGPVHARSL